MAIKLGPEFEKVLKQRNFKRMNKQPDVGEAFAILKEAINKDPSYAYGWHCNLKFAYFDSFPDIFWTPDDTEKHKICEEAAGRFMKNCFDVVTGDDMLD